MRHRVPLLVHPRRVGAAEDRSAAAIRIRVGFDDDAVVVAAVVA